MTREALQSRGTGRDLSREQQDELEALIDECGLCAVLQGLSAICEEKADHIESYSTHGLAKTWRQAGGIVGLASVEPRILQIGLP